MNAYPSSLRHAPAHSVYSRGTPRQVAAFLDAHNTIRAQHNATALTWSDDLAQKAESWADRCQFQHSNGVLSDQLYGEIVAAGTGLFPISAAVATFVQDKGKHISAFPFEQTNFLIKSKTKTNMILPIHRTFISPRWSGSQPRKSAVLCLAVLISSTIFSGLHRSTSVYTILSVMLLGKHRESCVCSSFES